MRTRTPLAVLLVFVPAVALAQGHGRGPSGPHPRGHAGSPPAHGHARGAGTHGNSHGKAHASGKGHDAAGKAHGPQSATAHLEAQPELRAQLQQRLPAGTNIDAAADGFSSLGRFVAAVNVSKNLGIPFDQLKPRITGDGAIPLGQAIHELRPDVDGGAEAARAERDASALVEGRQ